jgi:3-deoxy-D-manno-octulosonic-acid transferase
MRYILDLFYLLVLLLLSPWLVYNLLTRRKVRRGLRDKFLGRGLSCTLSPSSRRVWFHGVSVGEVHLLRQVVAAFRQRHPDWHCVVSTTTDTGHEEARKHFPDLPVFFFPFDFSWAVKRALKSVNPDLVVLAEGDLWPNYLREAKAQGSTVVVINGRLSPRSAGRYRKLRWLTGPLWRCIDLLAVQTQEYADAFVQAGAPAERIQVSGSVKFDGALTDRGHESVVRMRQLLNVGPADRVLVLGSTQAPEEEVGLKAFLALRTEVPGLRLILVPRQRERFDEVAALVERCGVLLVRRSNLSGPIENREAVILIDTMGELSAVWGLAEVAFVGGSLDGRRGGQNMLEPAAYGAAVVFGPHVWNFKEAAARLVAAGGAIQVSKPDEVEAVVRSLLADPNRREQMGTAARQFVLAQQGATARTIQAIESHLVIGSSRAA